MDRLNKYSVCRHLKADIGHRLMNHEGQCRQLHGHEYKFEIWARAADLDDIGRVIDFSVIKNVVGAWIDQNWDHGMLLHADDPLTQWFVKPIVNQKRIIDGVVEYFDVESPLYGNKIFCMLDNPTAENIAGYLKKVANELLQEKYGIRVFKVVVHETSNCCATAED